MNKIQKLIEQYKFANADAFVCYLNPKILQLSGLYIPSVYRCTEQGLYELKQTVLNGYFDYCGNTTPNLGIIYYYTKVEFVLYSIKDLLEAVKYAKEQQIKLDLQDLKLRWFNSSNFSQEIEPINV